MWVCVCLHPRITVSQCVQLSVVVFIWRQKSEAGSVLGPLTSDRWPQCHSCAQLGANNSNMCVCTYNCVIDLLPAGTHTEWKNARLKCRRAHLAFCIWTITYTTAELRRRRERSSFLFPCCVSERKAEIRNAIMWYCSRIKVWVRSGALAYSRNQL